MKLKKKIKIREAKIGDLEAIYRIGLLEEGFAVSSETRFYGKGYLKNWIENPGDDILLVAEFDDKVVGFAFASAMINKWVIWENLAVAERAQGQGVGKALAKEVFRRIKERGIDYIAGWVRVENKVIRKFLKKKGFEEGFKFIWVEKKTKPLWPEHKKDLVGFRRRKK